MRWSKLRQRIESNFADELKGRVQAILTRLRETHDAEQRGTIVVDGKIWFDACFFKHTQKAWELRETGLSTPDAEHKATAEGQMPGWQFPVVLFAYLSRSIEEALDQPEPLSRILAVLDNRTGKRRLLRLTNDMAADPVILPFLRLRMEALGLPLHVPQQPSTI